MAQVARRGFGKARYSLPAEATTTSKLATINPEMEIRSDMSFNTRTSVGVAIIGERNKLNGELSDLSKTKKHLLEQIERERMQLLNEQRKKDEEARERSERLEEAERKMKIEEEQEAARRKEAADKGHRRSDGKPNSYTRVCSKGDKEMTRKPRSIMKLKRLTTKEMDQLMDRHTEPKHDRIWWLEQNRKMEAQRQEARMQEINGVKSKLVGDQNK